MLGGEDWVKTVLERARDAEKRLLVESCDNPAPGLSNVLALFQKP